MRPPSPSLSLVERPRPEFGTESTRRSTRRLGESSRGRKRSAAPRVVLLRNLSTEMPSVEMRRTTRVFGMAMAKGGVDGARVLRSGRRLWPESSESKLVRAHRGDEDWLKVMKSHASDSVVSLKNKRWPGNNHIRSPKQHAVVLEVPVVKKLESNELLADEVKEKRMYGIVYTRKRKRGTANVENDGGSDDRMYGRRFVRRQRRKVNGELDSHVGFVSREVFYVSIESSCSRRYWATRFLYSVLVYMTRASLGLTELSDFLASEPIGSFFSSCGIQFSRVRSCTRSSGICKLFGSKQFIPLFSVDFSAVPFCFMDMHTIIHLRYKCQPTINNQIDGNESDDDYDEEVECTPVWHSSARVPKLAYRNTQYRNDLNSLGVQKRSSLRRRRTRNPSLVSSRKPNGALVSELTSIRKNGLPFSSVASINKRRKTFPTSPVGNLKEDSSTMERLTRDLDSACCSANVLITEGDKCYKEDGATVMLEISSSGEWLLVVKKEGLTRYTYKAEKVMRPCSINRLTNVIMWSADNGDNWKLEFPNRCDWYIFKDLYKECSDRSVPSPALKFIPVPGVYEVPGYADSHRTSFHRPELYISLNDDELSRAMAKRNANYDMDSDDEGWLKKFNSDFAEDKLDDLVSEDKFELIVDAIEKAFYYRPYNFSDENPAANLCLDMKREVIEAVYSYWMDKRKQKRLSSLLRVFQANQSKRSLLDPKPILRKRRSFKRQPSQSGRGNQPSCLQAMAAEQDVMQEQNDVVKVEEAKDAAERSVEFAICKRQRAQLLIQNADLVTYKATMAFRIAEAALVLGSPDAAADYVLD